MAEIPPGLTNARVEEKHLTPIRLMFQGLANIRVNHTGVTNALLPADTIRNSNAAGGHLIVKNAAGTANLLSVFDAAITLGTSTTINTNSASLYALNIRNSGAGGKALKILDSAGADLLAVENLLAALTGKLTVTANDGSNYAVTFKNSGAGGKALKILESGGADLLTVQNLLATLTGRLVVVANDAAQHAVNIQNTNATGFGLRVLNAAGTEARLNVVEAGVTITGNSAAAHALSVQNLGAVGLGLVVLHSAGAIKLLEVTDIAVTTLVPLAVTATDAVNYAATIVNLGAAGLALRVKDSTNLIDLLLVNDASVTIAAKPVYIGATANTRNTFGLTINQVAADDEILSLKSSDVAHGVTGITATDTYGYIKKVSAADGGLRIFGFAGASATVGMRLDTTAGTDTTTKSTAADGKFTLHAWTNSGTTIGAVGTNGNLVAVTNAGTARFILDAEGDSHQDVGTAWTNFDDMKDVNALTTLSYEVARPGNQIREEFGRFLTESREDLERVRLVQFNDDGHHFVNMSKLQMLTVGAVRQLALKLALLEEQLLALPGGRRESLADDRPSDD